MLMKNYGTLKGANIHYLEDVEQMQKDMNFDKQPWEILGYADKDDISSEMAMAGWSPDLILHQTHRKRRKRTV